MPGERIKVAVLGGGVGAMTAAFELTRPELGDRFEVTVFQPGWRLGGKGASGRNLAAGRGGRIEEHGLHLWFGFYANAFRVMRDVYAALPPEWPLRSVTDAFEGCNEIVLFDRVGDEWHSHSVHWPPTSGDPWDEAALPGFWDLAARTTRWALGSWRELRDQEPGLDLPLVPALLDRVLEEALELAVRLARLPQRLGPLSRLPQPPALAGLPGPVSWFVSLLGRFRNRAFDELLESAQRNPRLRLFLTTLDAFTAIATGVVADDLLERGWNAVDDEEWGDWLARHGASPLTLGETPADRAPVLRSVYDVAFGYPGGRIERANVAAGTATNDLLRLLFTYRGHLFYKMRAGMGDIVFAPLYRVLRDRGVRFRFFTAVSRLGVSGDGRLIDELDVVPQAELAPGRDEYEPLVEVRGLPSWPSEPLWGQLAEADRRPERDFEGEIDPLGRGVVRLRRGEHFDHVVLGISVGALEGICGELMAASDAFRAMVEGAVTVRTQAFQVWLREHPEELGWERGDDAVAGTYVEPLDTFCDMSDLLSAEDWEDGDEVRAIAYFCGVLDDREGESAAEATARAKENALEFLRRDAGPIWPRAVAGGPGSRLRWEVLADPDGREGEARFDAQYWRANTSPSERYVLTPAGSVRARLPSDRSGFENLVLAGDWTRNGIDGGCVEAAATSGVQAARALSGERRSIVGEDPRWLHPARSGVTRTPEEARGTG